MEHIAYLEYLTRNYPATVEKFEIGKSFEGRSLMGIKISNKNRWSDTGSETRPAIWIQGGIHAREWISPATVAYMIHQIVEPVFKKDANDLAHFDIYIAPLVNPDG